MQKVKVFRRDHKNIMLLEKQINEYLEKNTDHYAKAIGINQGPGYTEAYVLFDIRENKEPDEPAPAPEPEKKLNNFKGDKRK